jgi:hypothetical protein
LFIFKDPGSLAVAVKDDGRRAETRDPNDARRTLQLNWSAAAVCKSRTRGFAEVLNASERTSLRRRGLSSHPVRITG